MEYFILRIILLIQFYGEYYNENNYMIIGFMLLILALNLIYLNWNEFKFILALECIISFIISIYFPIAGIISSLSLLQFINSISKTKVIYMVLSYMPLINSSSLSEAIKIGTFLSIINLFVYISQRYLKELKNKGQNIEGLENEVYNTRRELEVEKESKQLQLHNLQLEERNKLSGKMHDKVGHIIATSLMQLRAANLIIDKDTKLGKEMLNSSIQILNDGMNDIRKTLKEIKPMYGDIGINRIKALLDEKIKYSNFTYSFIYKGILEEISTEQWTLIIDSIKELTTNTLKYSKGNKIIISLEVLNEIIKLSVKDNGEVKKLFNKNIGLTSMEEKVFGLHGNFVINTHDGFEVVIILRKEEKK